MCSPYRGVPHLGVVTLTARWARPGRARPGRLCRITQRGRSVTRLTRLGRMSFRRAALAGWCWGLTPAGW